MKIEDQVCTFEQAAKLKTYGINQDRSAFAFVADKSDKKAQLVYTDGYEWSDYPCHAGYPFITAAFTVAELGIMLGDGHPSWQFEHPKTKEKLFIVTLIGPNDPLAAHKYKNSDLIPMNTYEAFDRYKVTEAEARAELLIACINCSVPTFTIKEINKRLLNA